MVFTCLFVQLSKGRYLFSQLRNSNQVLILEICRLLMIVNLMLVWGGVDRYLLRPTA